MKAVSYQLKKINSDVPLYDEKTKTFGILIDDELVEIPKDIFHLLFEKGKKYTPSLDVQLCVREELKNVIKNNPEVLESIRQVAGNNKTKNDMMEAMSFFLLEGPEKNNSEDYKFFISELIELALTKKE